MPTLHKRRKKKEAKTANLEDGGSDALNKELINVEARSVVIEHAFRNMLTMLSFGMVVFSLYHAWGDMNTNIYMSTFEISNAVLGCLSFRYARDRTSPTFVKYLVFHCLQFCLHWGRSHEIVLGRCPRRIHCFSAAVHVTFLSLCKCSCLYLRWPPWPKEFEKSSSLGC